MDKSRSNNSKSNSAISNNKTDRKSLRNSKENAKNPGAVVKKRGVYVEKLMDDGIKPQRMEEVKQKSNKKLIESVLIILTKSSKATQWPDEKNFRKNIIKFKNNENIPRHTKKEDEGKDRKPVVLKSNTIVNKITPVKSKFSAGNSLAKTKSSADKTPLNKLKVGEKPAPTKSKFAVNKMTTGKSKTTVNKTNAAKSKIADSASQKIKPKFVAHKFKRFLLRKASPANTLISDRIIIRETPKDSLNDIETNSEDILNNSDHDAKIYSLIKDFLETTINTCHDGPSDKSDTNLHIDEEVAKKLMIKGEEDSKHNLLNNLENTDTSSTTTRKSVENNVTNVTMVSEKSQAKIKAGTGLMADVKVQKEDKIKRKKSTNNTKNVSKSIVISNKMNQSPEHSKQKGQRKQGPVPKFVNRSDYLVQHIYNIQLDSHTLKTKKVELVKHLKNPSVFQKPQNFFETLSLILKNKNKPPKNYNDKMESKLKHLKKISKINKYK